MTNLDSEFDITDFEISPDGREVPRVMFLSSDLDSTSDFN